MRKKINFTGFFLIALLAVSLSFGPAFAAQIYNKKKETAQEKAHEKTQEKIAAKAVTKDKVTDKKAQQKAAAEKMMIAPPQLPPCTPEEAEMTKRINQGIMTFSNPPDMSNPDAKKWMAYFSDPANAKIMSDVLMRCADVSAMQMEELRNNRGKVTWQPENAPDPKDMPKKDRPEPKQ